jgi:hypothetical protein
MQPWDIVLSWKHNVQTQSYWLTGRHTALPLWSIWMWAYWGLWPLCKVKVINSCRMLWSIKKLIQFRCWTLCLPPAEQ